MFVCTTVSHLSELFPICANEIPLIPPYWPPVTNKSLVKSGPPKGANVFYLYNPVNEILLKSYFNKLIEQDLLDTNDIIIYLNPRYHKELDKLKLKREVLTANINFNKVALMYKI